MPDFWQFPTVSWAGADQAIYQARFMRTWKDRGSSPGRTGRKVWAFMGDGEMDEPESLGAISLAGREKLDNLIFVINCNLQRLDGPVRGNGKIIQELEGDFRRRLERDQGGLGLVLGSAARRDKDGLLRKRMEKWSTANTRLQGQRRRLCAEHFFGKYPELKAMVANLSDDDIWRLNRGGHDPHKVYAAYAAASSTNRPADRDPGQDRQGLRHGRGRRRPEHHAPAEEDDETGD
jgi:pyruvate dehydrogenase E1 component